ncbi:MAG: beta-hydroxyacyl-ACP dehydratase [Planctomycetes bacterium]|nr:beta-hydroxyacyl-ACP dehydratase [Planctomycetota bacterium]MCH7632483.1 beta-hydroxyacyl-ACP dehydratase [Planctomycetota bacterium]
MTKTTDLLSAIPHRPPFLFIDEVVEVDSSQIVARKFVDPESDFFRGHYPDRPVMPGVLICESCFQAGAMLIAHRLGGGSMSDGLPVLTRIGDARFKSMVQPGETLEVCVSLDDELDRAFYMTGRVRVGSRRVLRVSFCCMLADTEGEAA